jgi:hypothetical protein
MSEERQLEELTLDQIKEIAEKDVDPNLPIAEKREIYMDNLYRFMRDSGVYVPHIFAIIGGKLLDEITRSFEHRKSTDPPESTIHNYTTIDEYIDDDATMRHNLYVNEEAELILASLGDAYAEWSESPEPARPRYRPTRRPYGRRSTDPTRRPQRRPRTTLFRGGKTSKRTKKTKAKKTKKSKKSLKKGH